MTVDVSQTPLQAVVVIGQALVIQAHEVENSRVEVVYASRVDCRFEAPFVALAITEAFLHAGPGQKAGKRIRVVIASRTIGLQEWHASKLGSPNHKGIIQQPPAFHIIDQCRSWLIHNFRLHGVGLEDVFVGIPIGDTITPRRIASIEELNYPNTLLNQAAGQNTVFGLFAF